MSGRALSLLLLGSGAAALTQPPLVGTTSESYSELAQFRNALLSKKVASFKANRAAGLLKDATVVTPFGTVVGLTGNLTNQFLGIPYAAPPIGPLRWKAPQPVTPWATPLTAQWWGPVCPQSEWYWGIQSGQSEDCLSINLYVPAKVAPPGGWPVMLFFHGGSWTFGSGSFILYDGDEDVTIAQDVILATINYRLGPLGFLAGDLLKAESPDGSVGNYGFQDQRAALQFLIAIAPSFGGNAKQITLVGESAGGGSISSHLVAPRSQGLFQGAIIESGAFTPWTAQPYNISATRLPQLAANLGCAGAGDVLACLRALNYTAVGAGDHGLTKGVLEWAPCIDGVEIPADPRVMLAQGNVAPVPVLMGFNLDEGTLFNNFKTTLNASQYEPAIESMIGAGLGPQVAAEYPVSEYPTPWWALTNILTDSQMMCPTQTTGNALTSPGRNGGAGPGVYIYRYVHVLWIIEYIGNLFRPLGCFHGSELVNVFDLSILLWGAGEPQLATTFVGWWTTFAATGNPNGPGLPNWPAYGGLAQPNVAMIDTGASGPNVTIVQGVKSLACEFWGNISIPPSSVFGNP